VDAMTFNSAKAGSHPRPRLRANRAQGKGCARGSHYHPVFIRRAHGAVDGDVDGNVLIDFAGGIAA